MAELDTRNAVSTTSPPERTRGRDSLDGRPAAGTAVFALSMLVWASGQLVYSNTVVGAWGLFLAGGIGASIGLRLAVGDGSESPGRWHNEGLSWSLTAMLVLVGISGTLDGALRMFSVSAGVTLLVVGFVHAIAKLRRAQQQLAAVAVIEERQRVAADVHDIVGHALAVTMLHVNAARLSLPDRPDAAIDALQEAERNGRSSMNEIRGVVRLLRSDAGPSLQSLPDLDDLDALVQSFAGTGRRIDTVVDVDPERLSRLASVTLYRLAQEGLTNAVRHGVGPVEVELAMAADEVTLAIVNDIGDTSGQGGGVGLAAARARVRSIGGTFDAGPIERDRWQLTARVPT